MPKGRNFKGQGAMERMTGSTGMRRTSTVLSTFCSRFTPQGYRLDWTCSLLRGFDNIPHRVGRGLSSMRLIRFRYSGVKMLEPSELKALRAPKKASLSQQKAC